MSPDLPDSHRPFRWDLAGGDRLGSVLDRSLAPPLSYLGDLAECAGRVLARSDDADLYFVGRSADSVFDLLTGALSGTSWPGRLHRLPLSLSGPPAGLTPAKVRQLRANLAAEGLAPRALARRPRPVAFVDLVYVGRTYENLFRQLRDWVSSEPASWDAVRARLRFIGITEREKTSPHTWRWQQHADWTAELPRHSVTSVSIRPAVWRLLGNRQEKIEPSFHHGRWDDPAVTVPRRDDGARTALAEAVALVEAGRSREVRRGLARVLTGEPAISRRWLRALATELRR
jgi:hypothetical protein